MKKLHLISLILVNFVLFILIIPGIQADLVDNLISVWDLEDTTDSIGNNNLTQMGTVTFDSVECMSGTCGQFVHAGANYLKKDSPVQPLSGHQFTVNLWAQFNGSSSDTCHFFNFGLYSATSNVFMAKNGANTYRYGHESTNMDYTLADADWRGGYNMYTIRWNGTHMTAFVNATNVIRQSKSSTIGAGTLHIGRFAVADGYGWDGFMDEIYFWNRSLNGSDIEDLYNNGDGLFYPFSGEGPTPPTITHYNCTSCDPPNGDITEPYTTEDTTPTFKIETDENAWCRIGAVDQNYTTMGASRDCATTGNIQTHFCTLGIDEMIVNETDYIYFSCRDADDNEDLTSTSGPKEMRIISPQVDILGSDAIEKGINISIINPTIYNDQRVYVRTSANQQSMVTFDKVAVYGNQRWAFNYIDENESFHTFYNITPVFYFFEIADLTVTTIIDMVSDLINTTKT